MKVYGLALQALTVHDPKRIVHFKQYKKCSPHSYGNRKKLPVTTCKDIYVNTKHSEEPQRNGRSLTVT